MCVEDKLKEMFGLFMSSSKVLKSIVMKKDDCHKNNELSLNQILCLNVICIKGINTMSEISKEIGISNQQTTRVVDDLVDKGYVTRLRNPLNQRQILATKTEKADKYYEDKFKRMQSIFDEEFKGLDEEKLDELISALRNINNILSDINR